MIPQENLYLKNSCSVTSNKILKFNYFILKKNSIFFKLLEKELDKIALKYKPINSEEYIKLETLEKYLDEEGGLMIEPTPKFVFKTFDKLNEKIFINIGAHPIIDEPEEKYLVEMEVFF